MGGACTADEQTALADPQNTGKKANDCKSACLLGWCKEGCLSCTEPAQETLATCTGFTAGAAEPCEEDLKVAEGACTADEQTALADPQNTGKKANDCGTSSYNIFTGS